MNCLYYCYGNIYFCIDVVHDDDIFNENQINIHNKGVDIFFLLINFMFQFCLLK